MPLSQSEPRWSMEGYLSTHKTILLGTDSHLTNHAQVVMQGADVREDSGVRESDAETGKFNLTQLRRDLFAPEAKSIKTILRKTLSLGAPLAIRTTALVLGVFQPCG